VAERGGAVSDAGSAAGVGAADGAAGDAGALGAGTCAATSIGQASAAVTASEIARRKNGGMKFNSGFTKGDDLSDNQRTAADHIYLFRRA